MNYDGAVRFNTKIDHKQFEKDLKSMQSVSKKAFSAIGLAAGAMVTGIAAAGISFESAFAGVRKTVDATEQELTSLETGIRNLAKEIPVAADEIAGIAEAAGQLGIKTQNILEFSRVMADLGVATNLAGEEAASTLAKFANITNMSQEKFSNLGSTIVALGNNLATTEADIAAMSLRLAGAGSQAGMSEANILSFAGALSSVGIEAEAGGTAFSKLMTEMQLAVETGSSELNQYASVAGMTGAQFKKAFQEDASGAIIEFIKGLNNTERNGKSTTEVLADMGITEIRLSDALKRAAGASDVFADAVNLGNKAWEENNALTKEAEQRYQTTESKIKILGNQVKDLGITAWDAFSGPFGNAIDGVSDKVEDLAVSMESGKLSGAIENVGELFGGLVETVVTLADVALPPLVSVLGFVGDNFGLVAGTIGTVTAATVAYKGAVAAANVVDTARKVITTAQASGVAAHAIAVNLLSGNLLKENTVSAANTVITTANAAAKATKAGNDVAAAAAAKAHTAAQTALNTAMSANPIGLVVAALAALAVGIGAVIAFANRETEAEKQHRLAVEENCNAINERTKSIESASKARTETIQGISSESEHTESLFKELERLTDEDEKVTDANKDRAQFIIKSLNKALGTEIELTDDLRVSYGKAKDEIYELIKAKKAEAMSNAYQEDYTEALKNRAKAIEELSKAQKDVYDAEAPARKVRDDDMADNKALYDAGKIDYSSYITENTRILEDYAESIELLKSENKDLYDAVENAQQNLDTYNLTISQYEHGMTQLSGGDVQGAIDTFDSMGTAAQTAAANTDDAVAQLGSAYQQDLNNLNSALNTFKKTGTQEAYNAVLDAAEKCKSAEKEYKAAGGTLVNGMVKTMEGEFDISALLGTMEDSAVEIGETVTLSASDIQNQIDLVTKAQDELKGKNKEISESTMKALTESYPELAEKIKTAEDPSKAVEKILGDLNTQLGDAQTNIADLNDLFNNLPKEININVRIGNSNILNPTYSPSNPFGIGFNRRGTPGAHEGPAVVNDGNGTELIQSKDGSFRMVQSSGAALTYLNEGDRVYTAEQTRSMLRHIPHYANGIGNHGTTVSASTTLFGIPALLGKTAKELAETFTDNLGDALSKGLKENAEKMTEKFDKAVEVLDLQLEFGHIDEKQYFEQLKVLRDEYLTEGTREWYETTQEIYEHVTETVEDAKDNFLDTLEYELDMGLISEREYYAKLKEYRDTYLSEGTDEWRDYTSKIFNFYKDKAGEVLEEVTDKQEDMLGRFEDHTTLTKTVTVENFYEDGSSSTWSELNTSDKELKEITKFVDNLDEVEERLAAGGYDENFIKQHMDKIRQMSVDEGLEYTNLLLDASEDTFRKHIDIQQETAEAIKSLSAEAYEDEYNKAVNESVDIWTSALETAGFEVPEGFFDIGVDSATEFCEGFERHIESLFAPIREKVASLISDLPFSGDSGGYTSQSSYSPTINIYSSQDTTSEQLIAARNAMVLEKLRGSM